MTGDPAENTGVTSGSGDPGSAAPAPAATPPASGTPAAGAATPAQPQQGFGDFAREHIADLAGRARELADGKPPAPADGRQPTDPNAPAPTTDAAKQILTDFGFDAAKLPPEIAAPIAAKLGEWRNWYGQMEQYAAALQQQQAENAALHERLTQIANHPQLMQAIAAVRAGQTPGAAPQMRRPPKFETDVEAQLWEQNEAIRAEMTEYRRQSEERMAELTAWREGRDKLDRATTLNGLQGQITGAHAELDKLYPELANDPEKRGEWHAMAVGFLQGQVFGNQKMDIRQALEWAAKALHYEHAKSAGQREALEAGRKAARGSTLRDGQGNATSAAPAKSETLREFATRTGAALEPAFAGS